MDCTNGLYLYCTFLATQNAFYITSPIQTHSYTDSKGYHTGCQPAHQRETNHSYTFIHRCHSNRSNFGVRCLAQGHIDMLTGGAGNRTANLPTGGRLLYLLSLSHINIDIYWVSKVSRVYVYSAFPDIEIDTKTRMPLCVWLDRRELLR